MKISLTLLGIILVCHSCSSTNLMSLSVTEPATVSLPPNAKSAAVVNRSLAAEDNRTVDAIHRTSSPETRDLQVSGAGASLNGLTDALIRSNRFDSVKKLNNLDHGSYGMGVIPVYLSWDTVEKICRENHVDVLFSLELFDPGSTVGLNIANFVQVLNAKTQVETGWRIYDPNTRTILDQFFLYRDLNCQGGSFLTIGAAQLGRKEAVINAGNRAGEDYATRIIPYSIRVSRYYYVRGNGSFSVAKRMAQAGDWGGAANIWREATNSPSGKVAGRACYNMAIISEINGDLNGALQWARKAYEVYKTPYALNFANILQQRQSNDAVLKSQTEIQSPANSSLMGAPDLK
jgi:hypothetical protein